MSAIIRCSWCESNELMREYHDREWGVPNLEDRHHFEHLILEIFQAGLNWLTILKKRENFRKAFAEFDPQKIANFTDHDKEKLMNNAGIIRNRLKIEASVNNAKTFLKVVEKYGSFINLAMDFIPKNKNTYKNVRDIPGKTVESEAFSRELKKLGFKFVGPTGVYAYMQSVGLVNDHVKSCYRYPEIEKMNDYRQIL